MYYICNDCGHQFDRPKVIQESRGEFWGMPCYENMYYCPCCGSDNFSDFEGDDDEEQF